MPVRFRKPITKPRCRSSAAGSARGLEALLGAGEPVAARGLEAFLEPVRPKGRKLASEQHDLQVVLFRDYLGPLLVDGAVAYANANGGWRGWNVGKQLRDEGVTAGVPDITIIWHGKAYYLELKKAKGPRGGMRGAKVQASRLR